MYETKVVGNSIKVSGNSVEDNGNSLDEVTGNGLPTSYVETKTYFFREKDSDQLGGEGYENIDHCHHLWGLEKSDSRPLPISLVLMQIIAINSDVKGLVWGFRCHYLWFPTTVDMNYVGGDDRKRQKRGIPQLT